MSTCRLLLLSVVALATLTGFRPPLEGVYRGLGSAPPNASLWDVAGNPQRLSEAAVGWTLIKFGTTWCAQCGDGVRELNKLSSFLEAEGVAVVEVFVKEGPDTVRDDLEALPRKYRHRALIDRGGDTMVLYALRVIPRIFLVDPQGIVRLDTGYLQAPELKTRIVKALARR